MAWCWLKSENSSVSEATARQSLPTPIALFRLLFTQPTIQANVTPSGTYGTRPRCSPSATAPASVPPALSQQAISRLMGGHSSSTRNRTTCDRLSFPVSLVNEVLSGSRLPNYLLRELHVRPRDPTGFRHHFGKVDQVNDVLFKGKLSVASVLQY